MRTMRGTKKKGNLINGRDIAMQIAIFLFYVCAFSVILTSGLSADDMWNSNIQAASYLGGPGPVKVMLGQWKMWLEAGRIFPFSNYAALLFAAIPSVPAYKGCIIFMTWLSNRMVGLCIEKLTESKGLSVLYMLLFPVLIQMTPEFDSGLYCYHMLIQLVVFWCFLALWMQLRYLDTEKKRYAVGSTIAFFLALGTYEVAFPFLLVLMWVTFRICGSIRNGIRKLIPQLVLFFGMLSANGALRLLAAGQAYHGVAVNLQWNAVLLTWLKQCSTCIPLGRYICSFLKECRPYSEVYPYTIREIFSWLQIWDYIAVGLLIGLWIWLGRHTQKESAISKQKLWTMLIAGGLVFILPGILIAVSAKYQQTIAWAGGHLPAYMQTTGFVMMLAGGYWKLISGKAGWKRKLLEAGGLAAGVLLLILNISSARAGVEYMNQTKRYPQEMIKSAADAGFFDIVEDDKTKYVFGANGYIHDSQNSMEFYSKLTGMRIYACTDAEVLANSKGEWNEKNQYDLTSDNERVYYGIFNWAKRDSGLLLMGPCARIQSREGRDCIEWMRLENPQIYIRGASESVVPKEWEMVRSGDGYAIYQLYGSYQVRKEMDNWKEWIVIQEGNSI